MSGTDSGLRCGGRPTLSQAGPSLRTVKAPGRWRCAHPRQEIRPSLQAVVSSPRHPVQAVLQQPHVSRMLVGGSVVT
jgi:hypothetical protein